MSNDSSRQSARLALLTRMLEEKGILNSNEASWVELVSPNLNIDALKPHHFKRFKEVSAEEEIFLPE